MGNCFLYKRGGSTGGGSLDAFTKTVMGKVITLTDSAAKPFKGLRVFGKTTQNGTPTPDAPIPLESVGDSGAVNVTVCGKNLLVYPYADTTKTINGITFTDNGDGTITANGTATARAQYNLALDTLINGLSLNPGAYVLTGCPSGGHVTTYYLRAIGNTSGFDATDEGNGASGSVMLKAPCIGVVIRIEKGVTVSNMVFRPMIRPASITDNTYEPYKEQILPLSTPNGLPGIPVTSGGNYTDENGQQWICDEIDFGRGKYVQRIGKFTADGTVGGYNPADKWWYISHILTGFDGTNYGMCSHLNSVATQGALKQTGCCFTTTHTLLKIDSLSDATAYKNFLKENPITLYGVLATPTETPLSAEQLAAYAALHTNLPNTIIYNDAGADMEVKYTSIGG